MHVIHPVRFPWISQDISEHKTSLKLTKAMSSQMKIITSGGSQSTQTSSAQWQMHLHLLHPQAGAADDMVYFSTSSKAQQHVQGRENLASSIWFFFSEFGFGEGGETDIGFDTIFVSLFLVVNYWQECCIFFVFFVMVATILRLLSLTNHQN